MDLIGQSRLHYDIIEKLGEGGMGIVYKAFDNKLKREVAIKFLPWSVTSEKDIRTRFHIEAQAVATLNHPNIATIYAIEELTNAIGQEELFFVMEFIDGIELRQLIRGKQLELTEVSNIAVQVGDGLVAAHEKGITHRDIKPANIMITSRGLIKLMDFGLAKIGDGMQLTRANTTLGTVAYMSPEQALGETADLRSDVWAFGVVLYEMLTGKLPFIGKNTYELMNAIIHEKHTPLKDLGLDIPDELNSIVERALRKDPKLRYQSADGLSQDLHAFVERLDKTQRAKIKSVRVEDTVGPTDFTSYHEDTPSGSQRLKDSSSIIKIIAQKPVFFTTSLVAVVAVIALAWFIPRIGTGSMSKSNPDSVAVDSSTLTTIPPLPVEPLPTAPSDEEQESVEQESDDEEVADREQQTIQETVRPPPANPVVTNPDPAPDEEAERTLALRRQAQDARQAMLDQEAALSGSQELLQRLSSYSTATNRKSTAERLYNAGDYAQAGRAYAEAEALFVTLQNERTELLKSDAEQQQRRMADARAQISGNHPDVEEYTRAVALQREAEQSFASQDYLRASQLFEESAQGFTRAAEAIAALQGEIARKLTLYTEQLKGRIQQAIEDKNITELNTLLALSSEDLNSWETIFSAFNDLQLRFRNEKTTEIRFDRYLIEFDTSLNYKDNTNRSRSRDFMINGTLEYLNAEWQAQPLKIDADTP